MKNVKDKYSQFRNIRNTLGREKPRLSLKIATRSKRIAELLLITNSGFMGFVRGKTVKIAKIAI